MFYNRHCPISPPAHHSRRVSHSSPPRLSGCRHHQPSKGVNLVSRRSGPPDRAAGSLELNSGSGPMDALVVGAQSRCSIPT